IASIVAGGEMSLGLLFGVVFVLTGLAFKVSAVPFHMWTPDVYQGAPTAVTAFLATAPKVAALVLTGRVLHGAFGGVTADWQQIVALLAVLSMFLGAIAAIGQSDIKRMMAFSSIGHMGFALIGLAAGTIQGLEAMLLYSVIYVTMNIGTFAFIMYMERDGRPVVEIGSLAMLSRSHPAHALALLVLMFSLAGIPPLVGFFGKFAVLLAAVDAGMAWLAVLGVVASVIGAFYYLRICYLMYFGEQGEALDASLPLVASAALGLSAVLMVVGVVNLFGIDSLAAAAAQTVALR
ncbi:MAG: NADH-quinone oxidoreductase subunit N, partial [Rhodobacteraceae bacterium]|nr:NADH-quinone oxidoreductase subunit N [Paracoccaceae bacterium]